MPVVSSKKVPHKKSAHLSTSAFQPVVGQKHLIGYSHSFSSIKFGAFSRYSSRRVSLQDITNQLPV